MTVARTSARRLDLRLCLGAVCAWLAVLLCQGAAARTPAVIAVLLVCCGLAGIVTGHLARLAALRAAAMCCFCAALALAPLAIRLHTARTSVLMGLARQHAAVRAEVRVSSDPVALAARGVAGAPRVLVRASAVHVVDSSGHAASSGSLVVIGPAPGWSGVLPGQRVALIGTLAPPLTSGQLSVSLFVTGVPQRIGRPPPLQRAAGAVRAGLWSAAAGLPDQPRALLPGLVDGDTSGMDPVLTERFRFAGLTHLVAVSGTNLAVLLGVVVLGLRRARVRPWICAVVGVLVIGLFVMVARPSPSVLRAAVMALIGLAGLASGRPRAALPALGVTCLGLLVWDSGLAANAGFAMSVAATAALLIVAPGWSAGLQRWRIPAPVADAVAVAAAAHAATLPMIAAISGQVSLVSVPANVLAEPAVLPATVLGFVAALAGPVALPVARVAAQFAGWPCRWLVWIAETFGSLPGAVVPWPRGNRGGALLAAALVVLVWLARRAGGLRLIVAVAGAIAVVQFPLRWVLTSWPPHGLLMVACDVGQGDALVLPTGPGSALVVDTGPDPVLVDRCLQDLGVTRVPLLVVTHLRLDHVGGVVGVLHDREVDQVVVGPLLEPQTGLDLLRNALAPRHLAMQRLPAGKRLTLGPLVIDVLGPAVAFHGTHSDPNNSSLVLRVTDHGVRLLLAADMEIEAERALLDAHVDVHADVLKVAHHGSAYFDPSFLAQVGARVGVISVGLHNDYGHPAPSLLHALAGLGIPAYRTDLDGDVGVTSTQHGLGVVIRGKPSSAVGLARGPAWRRAPTRPGGASAVGDRMGTCRPEPSASTISPSDCPLSCSSSETRNCSSSGVSARSPPASSAPTLA